MSSTQRRLGVEAAERYVAQKVGLAQYTTSSADSTARVLSSWLRHADDWTEPTRDEVHGWVTAPASRAGKQARAAALRPFYRWAAGRGLVADRVALLVPSIRGSDKRPKPIPDEVLAGAIARAGDRDRRAILLGRFAGLRAMEIAALHSDHLHQGHLWIRGKGGRERWVPAHPDVERVMHTAGGWLFPNPRTGEPVTAATMSKWLSRALPAPWTGHTLRHAFATQVYDTSRDIVLTAELLGHKDTRITERYIKVRREEAVVAILRMKLVP